jgi:hypothetical protein
MDTYGTVCNRPVTHTLAGVVADTTVNRRHRVVSDEFSPCRFVVAILRQCEPGLDIFAGRTSTYSGRRVRSAPVPRAWRVRSALFVRSLGVIGQDKV